MSSKTLLALAIAGALGSAGTAFASSGTHHSAHELNGTVASDPLAMEVYIVPAPLAQNETTHYWTAKIEPTVEALDRVETENVYVMTPNYDAIVDPRIVLSQGLDRAMTVAGLSTGDTTVS